MRSPPVDLDVDDLRRAVTAGWGTLAESVEYVPEGGGSHHWKFVDGDGAARFVTVDDLDDKDWLGDDRSAVLDALTRALHTSVQLRDAAALEYVVAPIVSIAGDVLRRVTDRYTVSVFPYLVGTAHPFGPYRDPALKARAIAMMSSLHAATAVVDEIAPVHVLRFSGRRDLESFLDDPATAWDSGPFAAPAQASAAAHLAGLAGLVGSFDALAERTAAARARTVVTHGEPHPANLFTVDEKVMLLDWDTAAVGPPERDLWLIVSDRADIERYERASGRSVDTSVLMLYRLRWFLDDLGSAVRMFRNPHLDTADTRRWIEGLDVRLTEIDGWRERLASDSG